MRRAQGMFGNVAACRHTLGGLHRGWMAALCGTCLAVRDGSGQVSRALVTTDAVAAAVLAHEVAGVEAGRRRAGPCPARGMLPATVWTGPAAAVGASVSLLAAGIALDDKVVDGDLLGGRLLRRPAGRWAARIVGDARTGAANPILAGACTADEAWARIDHDLALVADRVDAARPGSLSAALWGPAWRMGVERAVAPALGRPQACPIHPAGSASGFGSVARPLAALAGMGVGVGVGMAPLAQWGPKGPRRRRRFDGDDACDCCCCACCCCDAADCC